MSRAPKKAQQSFTKIKSTGTRVELRWVTSERGAEHEHHVKSEEEPRPELTDSLNGFRSAVMELLGLEDTAFDEGLVVTGLSVDTGEDGRRGLIITCRKALEHGHGPLVFNTPHLREPAEDAEDGSATDAAGLWLPGMAAALARAEAAATGFLAGERAQLDLALQKA